MRFLLIIFSVLMIGFACVKPQTKNPVPVIAFKELANLKKVPTGSQGGMRDTAVLVISYEDGDGDLFLDNAAQGPNFIFTPYFYNEVTNRFQGIFNTETADTHVIASFIMQPDKGYYKGKSIKGEIFIPLTEYRPNDDAKIIKIKGFAIDVKGNKSNIISSPAYTLNY